MRPSRLMLAGANGADRPPWRLLQPGPPGTPAHQPTGAESAWPRSGLVAGLGGESAERRGQGHGAVRGALRVGRPKRAEVSDPRQRFRTAPGPALHGRCRARTEAAPPRASFHLVAWKRHPAKF